MFKLIMASPYRCIGVVTNLYINFTYFTNLIQFCVIPGPIYNKFSEQTSSSGSFDKNYKITYNRLWQ